jgi:hypothetical protein
MRASESVIKFATEALFEAFRIEDDRKGRCSDSSNRRSRTYATEI